MQNINKLYIKHEMELQFYTHVNTLIYYYQYTKYDAIINFMNSGYNYNEIIEIVNNELNDANNQLNAVPIIPLNPVNINILNQLINNPGIINQYQINTIHNQAIIDNNNQVQANNQANIINQLNDNQIHDHIHDDPPNNEEFDDEFFENPPPPPKLARH